MKIKGKKRVFKLLLALVEIINSVRRILIDDFGMTDQQANTAILLVIDSEKKFQCLEDEHKRIKENIVSYSEFSND